MRKLIVYLVVYLFLLSAFFIAVRSFQDKRYLKNESGPLNPFYFLTDGLLKTTDTYTPGAVMMGTIFSEDHSWTATLSANRIRTLVTTGDVIPARSVNVKTVTGKDFLWPYKHIAPLLKSGDIAFINLETPLLKDCLPKSEGMIFCGSSRQIEGLNDMGVDIVSFANNHMANYGTPGITETKKLLKDNGILATGTSGPAYVNVRGKQIAFLGYDDINVPTEGISHADDTVIVREVREAHKQADIVVVMFHWGTEYVRQPNNRQIHLAHLTVDAGADLVLGNHPHWIEPVELYHGKFIIYAHGNTVFDQMWSEETKYGVIGRYVFYDNTLIDVQYFPIYIVDYGQASLLQGEQKERILRMLEVESRKIMSVQ